MYMIAHQNSKKISVQFCCFSAKKGVPRIKNNPPPEFFYMALATIQER